MTELSTQDQALLERMLTGELDADAPELQARLAENHRLASEWRALSGLADEFSLHARDETADIGTLSDPETAQESVDGDRAEVLALAQLGSASTTNRTPRNWSRWLAAAAALALAAWLGMRTISSDSDDGNGGLLNNGQSPSGLSPTGSVPRATIRKFHWSGIEPRPEYRLQIRSLDGSFSQTFYVVGNSFDVSDELRTDLPDAFFWTLKATAPDGEDVVLISQMVSLLR